MKNPFPINFYGGPSFFCDRESETKAMVGAALNGRNVTLISPRRLGKTLLIWHVFHQLKKEKVIGIYCDIFKTTDLTGLSNSLVTSIMQTFPQRDSIGKRILDFIKVLRPLVKYDPYTGYPVIEIGATEPSRQKDTLAQLLQWLDNEKESVIAFDEFQQILTYSEKGIEAWLRSEINHLKNTRFIFAGSQQHLLIEMFNSSKRPFYGSTQLLKLEKISKGVFAHHIQKMFAQHKFAITEKIINQILEWTECHTYSTQLTCNRLFEVTEKEVTESHLKHVQYSLLTENESVYLNIRGFLTPLQWKLLKALAIEGTTFTPTSSAFIKKHDLPGSSTILKGLKALTDRDLVYVAQDEKGGHYKVNDVFLNRWMEIQF